MVALLEVADGEGGDVVLGEEVTDNLVEVEAVDSVRISDNGDGLIVVDVVVLLNGGDGGDV